MKVLVGGLDLAEAVGKVIKATSTRSLNPLLEGIKLKAQDGMLTLTGTDLELTIEKRIKADISRDGETVIPGKFFFEYTKKTVEDNVELVISENRRFTIKHQDSTSTVNCMNEDEYPPIKVIDSGEFFEIEQNAFKDFLAKIVFSAAQDSTRPILKGCLFDIQDGILSGVALDGFRLAKCVKRVTGSTANMSAVVPARSLSEMQKILSDSEEKVKIYRQRNYLMLELPDTKIITKLLDGDFVNYNLLIPKDFASIVTLSKSQFETSLERASLLSRTDKNNLVKLSVNENVMYVNSESDLGTAQEKLAIKLDGHDMTIAFNVRYLTEALRAISDEFVKLKLVRPDTPCLLTSTADESEYVYLILPIRIR